MSFTVKYTMYHEHGSYVIKPNGDHPSDLITIASYSGDLETKETLESELVIHKDDLPEFIAVCNRYMQESRMIAK